MKIKIWKLAPAVVAALLFAGCSSTPTEDPQSSRGADVTEASGDDVDIRGARDSGEMTLSPLNDPASPLYNKVIYFEYDASTISPGYQDVVIAHGRHLAANPGMTVTVEGHADERGSREYNIALGERRANAVRDLLIVQGVADSQITTVSYGEERPADPSSNETAWAQNRRVELVYGIQR